jgi:histidyl-tRNA synthetase
MADGNKVSKDPYKGVRDFYPEDQFIQNYIFDIWRATAQRYGYKEYNASILEPADLYRSKSSEEIVNEQTYTFTDRGGREVTLRPEMTPTVARMIARKRRELSFPLRWFSIPNVFRYERPQKGRLREHWQLNVDAFGLSGVNIEIEILSLAHEVMRMFGLKDSDFEIRVSDRGGLAAYLATEYKLSEDKTVEFFRLLDKKDKMDDFDEQAKDILGKPFDLSKIKIDNIDVVLERLRNLGISNARFDPSIVRGFDYYTGVVFEIFDTNPKNNRSIFGGGRYDKLIETLGGESTPAIGFGMGDVTIRDALESRNLLPPYTAGTQLYICTLGPEYVTHAEQLAQSLRTQIGISIEVDLTTDKVGSQIKKADKNGAALIICIGEDEVKNKSYNIKNLKTGEETVSAEEKLSEEIDNALSDYYRD